LHCAGTKLSIYRSVSKKTKLHCAGAKLSINRSVSKKTFALCRRKAVRPRARPYTALTLSCQVRATAHTLLCVMGVCAFMCARVRVCACVCLCKLLCIQVRECVRACSCVCMHSCMYVCVCERVCACMLMCMCVSAGQGTSDDAISLCCYASLHTNTHIYKHKYTHTYTYTNTRTHAHSRTVKILAQCFLSLCPTEKKAVFHKTAFL
jgi:hypothetical protein